VSLIYGAIERGEAGRLVIPRPISGKQLAPSGNKFNALTEYDVFVNVREPSVRAPSSPALTFAQPTIPVRNPDWGLLPQI